MSIVPVGEFHPLTWCPLWGDRPSSGGSAFYYVLRRASRCSRSPPPDAYPLLGLYGGVQQHIQQYSQSRVCVSPKKDHLHARNTILVLREKKRVSAGGPHRVCCADVGQEVRTDARSHLAHIVHKAQTIERAANNSRNMSCGGAGLATSRG